MTTHSGGNPDDEDLARLIARRDDSDLAWGRARDAFDHLYGRHARLILAFIAARAPGDDADDIHQEVWQRVWEKLPGHYQAGHFRGWLHKVARNVIADFMSQKPRTVPIDDSSSISDSSGHGPIKNLIGREEAEALGRCLDRLDARSRELVKARLEGVDYSEIGLKLGIDADRAYKIFYKAKERLRDCLKGVGP
jgi:RNA polymerase sigma-70 factor, ECF subfamily